MEEEIHRLEVGEEMVRPSRTFLSDRPMANFSGDHREKRLDGVVLAADSSFILVVESLQTAVLSKMHVQLNSTQVLYD